MQPEIGIGIGLFGQDLLYSLDADSVAKNTRYLSEVINKLTRSSINRVNDPMMKNLTYRHRLTYHLHDPSAWLKIGGDSIQHGWGDQETYFIGASEVYLITGGYYQYIYPQDYRVLSFSGLFELQNNSWPYLVATAEIPSCTVTLTREEYAAAVWTQKEIRTKTFTLAARQTTGPTMYIDPEFFCVSINTAVTLANQRLKIYLQINNGQTEMANIRELCVYSHQYEIPTTQRTGINAYLVQAETSPDDLCKQDIIFFSKSLKFGDIIFDSSDTMWYYHSDATWHHILDPLSHAAVTVTDTNSINLTLSTQALSADLIYQDTTSVDLAVDASGLKATVLPAGVDHNSLANLTTSNPHTQYQGIHANLTSLASLVFASTSFVKMTATGGFNLDVNTYSLSSHNHSSVYQPLNTQLTDIAALGFTDGTIIVGNGTTWVAETGATARTSLGLAIGTDVQAYNANLTSVAELTYASVSFVKMTAAGIFALDTTVLGTMAVETATNYIPKSLYDAYSILIASNDNDPIALSVGTSRIIGRAAAGAIDALDASTVKTILSLSSVENTALSTWGGSGYIVALGTVTGGTWNAAVITTVYGGTGLSGATPFTANGVFYASSTSVMATSANLTYDGAAAFAFSHATNPAFTITDTTNTVTCKLGATDTLVILGASTNHAVSIISNNTERIGVSAAGAVTIPNLTAGLRVCTGTGGLLQTLTAEVVVAYGTSSTTIANNADTIIIYNHETSDVNNWYNTSTGVFTPTVAGWYYIHATAMFTDLDSNIQIISIYKNNATYNYQGVLFSNWCPMGITGLVYLNGTTDYIDIRIFQNSGESHNVYDSHIADTLHIARIA